MSLIMMYMKSIFLNLLPFIPIIILIRIVAILLLRKDGIKTTIHHEMGTAFFIYFMIALFSLTINISGLLNFLASGIKGYSDINIIPFSGIKIILQSGDIGYIFVNILGNILIFSPTGFLLPLLWKKTKTITAVVFIGFMISLLIECIQFFSSRGSDVDDLILNTVGTFLGYIIFSLFYRVFPKFADRFLINNTCH